MIVLRDAERETALIFAARVRRAINAAPFVADTQRIPVACSIGWVAFPFRLETPRELTLEQVIALADQALYGAQENGRDCIFGALATVAQEICWVREGATTPG